MELNNTPAIDLEAYRRSGLRVGRTLKAARTQAVRKLRGTSSRGPNFAAYSGAERKNHENPLAARLYGAADHVCARSACTTRLPLCEAFLEPSNAFQLRLEGAQVHHGLQLPAVN